jgi:hypothetical protein
MAHIDSLSSGIFSYLDIFTDSATVTPASETAAGYATLFDTNTTDVDAADLKRMPSVREFPSIGTPANIVNVPVYGQNTSSQIQGQSDAPTLEVTVNYVAADMEDFHTLVGQQVYFRFMMCETATELSASNAGTNASKNTSFYFKGKIEAILVNPQLTDATTATVTLSAQSDFFGPATV